MAPVPFCRQGPVQYLTSPLEAIRRAIRVETRWASAWTAPAACKSEHRRWPAALVRLASIALRRAWEHPGWTVDDDFLTWACAKNASPWPRTLRRGKDPLRSFLCRRRSLAAPRRMLAMDRSCFLMRGREQPAHLCEVEAQCIGDLHFCQSAAGQLAHLIGQLLVISRPVQTSQRCVVQFPPMLFIPISPAITVLDPNRSLLRVEG